MSPRRGLIPVWIAALLAIGCGRERLDRIVLITLDTVRQDALLDDEADARMPAVRALFDRATTFHGYHSVSASTQPSHATFLTGLQPWEHGVTGNGMVLSADLVTLPELLVEAGWTTGAVVASFPVSSGLGFSQGFEVFDDDFDRGRTGKAWQDLTSGEPQPLYRLAPDVETAVSDLRFGKNRPQFLWIHFFDAHAPYGDASGGDERNPAHVYERVRENLGGVEEGIREARSLYDDDLRQMDRTLAGMISSFLEDPVFRTSILLVSDHGESFGEDGSLAHGRRLTPSQIRVPLVIWSEEIAAGRREEAAGSMDVAATLAAWADVRLPETGGRDLSRGPAGRNPTVFGARRTYEQPYQDLRLDGSVVTIPTHPLYFGVVDGRLVRGTGTGILEADREGLSPAATEWLRARFAAFENRRLAGRSPDAALAPEELENLEALGYVP